MGRTTIFVVAYSAFLMALFFTMCYLMTTVTPTPMERDDSKGGNENQATKKKPESRRKGGADVTAGEKGDASDKSGSEGAGGNEGTREKARGGPNYHLSVDQNKVNSYKETLQQFIREYSKTERKNRGKKPFFFVTIAHRENENSTAELTSPAVTSPKMDIPSGNLSKREYNRRSINAVKQENNTDFVFKIVDEDGYPRVEIKVNSKMKKIRKRKHLRLKATHKNVENENKELSEHSKVVLIMFPNNTLSFEEKNEIRNETNATAEVKEITDNEEKIKDNFVSYNGTNKYKSVKTVNFTAADDFTKTNLNDTIISGLLDGKNYTQNEIRNISSVLDGSVAVITEVLKDDVKNPA